MIVVEPADVPPADRPAPERWSDEQVVALAPGRIGPARAIAEPSGWSGLGADEVAMWGQCGGAGREPYDVAVDHEHVQSVCSCPSRQRPCKHALALMLLWAHGQVPAGERPPRLRRWLAGNAARAAASAPGGPAPVSDADEGGGPSPGAEAVGEAPPRDREPAPERPPPTERDSTRAARVAAGLAELDRWLVDRMRAGLSDPALASYATWDAVAARLVDAQAGGLANRVRRIGAAVGTRSDWHDHVLAEIGVLHLLASAGQRLGELPPDLADGVAAAVGWQVRQADVVANTPQTDTWFVAGRSDALEDRIVVRRLWLRGVHHGWAMLLSFAAFGQSLADWPRVGTCLQGDLHRYPGAVKLRALLGEVVEVQPGEQPPLATGVADAGAGHQPPLAAGTVDDACAEIGFALATEPWLERHPFAVRAAVSRDRERWVLTDGDGSLPLLATIGADELAVLLAATARGPVTIVGEWTALGVVPIAAHTGERSIDLGPREGFTGRPLREIGGRGRW